MASSRRLQNSVSIKIIISQYRVELFQAVMFHAKASLTAMCVCGVCVCVCVCVCVYDGLSRRITCSATQEHHLRLTCRG